MITWRNLAYDLKLLSSNALGYPLFYILGFGAYLIQMEVGGQNNVAAPLFALSLCVLTHISSERADRVSDQITIEHGGKRRRLIARMASIAILNGLLILLALLAVAALRTWRLDLPPLWALTALGVVTLFSTAGVLIAAALPHPAVSLVLTSLLLFTGGTGADTNLFSQSLNQMILSPSINQWTSAYALFAGPWLALAILLSPLATGRMSLSFPRHTKALRVRRVKVPSWISKKPTFRQTAFRQFTTNPLPALGTLFGMVFYTIGTISLASKIESFHIQGNHLPAFAGLVMANVIPAVILGSSIQRREVDDQESLLFASSRKANFAKVTQTSLVVLLSASLVLYWIAEITNSGLSLEQGSRVLIVVATLTPALTRAGIRVAASIRSPLLLTLASYALTLPELAIVWLSPGLAGWLPSSLVAAAAGGPSAYLQPGSDQPNEWLALAVVGLIAATAYPRRLKVSA